MKKHLLPVIFPFLLVGLSGCSSEPSYVEKAFSLEGERWTFKLYDGSKDNLEGLYDLVDGAYLISDPFLSHDGVIDVYDINKTRGESVTISSNISSLLVGAISRFSKTSGYYDYLMGDLTSLWDLALANKKTPSQAEIDEALSKRKSTSISLSSNSVILSGQGRLDLNGIKKGFALSLCESYLKSKSIKQYALDAGGGEGLYGENPSSDDKLFKVKLDNLNGKTISIKNSAMMISDIYGEEVAVGGKTYSSIINPKNGNNEFSNEVAIAIGDDPMSLDVLSKVFSLLGESCLSNYESTRDGARVYSALGNKEKIAYVSSGLTLS